MLPPGSTGFYRLYRPSVSHPSPFSRMMTEAPREDDYYYYNPPKEMNFSEWTKQLGQLTKNADRWDNFYSTTPSQAPTAWCSTLRTLRRCTIPRCSWRRKLAAW